MTAPDGGSPPGSMAVGLFRALQTKSVDDMKATMSGGIMGAYDHIEDNTQGEIIDPIGERPTFTQTPIDMAMWGTMNPKEHSSIPRSQLINGTASSTASGGSSGSAHSHNLNRTPDYQPDGNEGETAFIRMTRSARLRYVGFCTGDANEFLGITRAHLGVYRVNQTTGLMTQATPTLAATDIKAQIVTDLTEFVWDMGVTLEVEQNEVLAITMLQVTSGLQTPGAIMCARIKKTGRWNGTRYPLFQYCWTDPSGGHLPSTIPAANQHWNNDPMTVPFCFLREE